MTNPAASDFIKELHNLQSDKEAEKIRRYFEESEPDNLIIGVRMKMLFDLAKTYREMPLSEIENLLESPYYEGRMGAVSIMDFQVRPKSATAELRQQLFELYINRHDRINNWDFVDRAAPRVVGSYLYDFGESRDILYKLAGSGNPWERRTAIVSTGWFIRKGETGDTYRIAKHLLDDPHNYVQKAVGTWVRHAGKKDEPRLLGFLEEHAPDIRRTTLTIMMENLDPQQKKKLRNRANQ
jgi:3-methyladenine DNA glycosylase AlkD